MTIPKQKSTELLRWHLVSSGGAFSLQVRSSLILGEDALGELRIDSLVPSERWIRLAPQNGKLLVEILRDEFVLKYNDDRLDPPTPLKEMGQGISIESGSLLVLPRNELFLSTNATSDAPCARIALMRVVSTQLLEDIVVTEVEPYLGNIAPPILTDQVVTKRDDDSWRASQPSGSRIGMLLFLMGLAAIAAFTIHQLSAVPADETLASTPVEIAEQVRVPPVKVTPIIEEPSAIKEPSANKEPSAPIKEPSATKEPSAPEKYPSTDIPTQIKVPPTINTVALQKHLENARLNMALGYISAPPTHNAVKELQQALYIDPYNAEALELMSEASNRLLVVAEEAREAGLLFEARNLLEELLAFHPQHTQARLTWEAWTTADQTRDR